MDSGTQVTIPPEAYYAIGLVIVTNFGAVIAFIKSLMNNSAEKAITQKTIQDISTNIGEIKMAVESLKKDNNEAHAKIRELNVKWQLRNTDV